MKQLGVHSAARTADKKRAYVAVESICVGVRSAQLLYTRGRMRSVKGCKTIERACAVLNLIRTLINHTGEMRKMYGGL